MSLDIYRERLKESIEVFRQHKKIAIRDARQADRQILPSSIIDESSSYTSKNTQASMIVHPGVAIIHKKYVEELTALAPRYEWQSNNPVGEIAREALEIKFRTLYSRSNIAQKTRKLYSHSVLDGLAVVQSTTEIQGEDLIYPNGEKETIKGRRTVSMLVYDPLTTWLDPNADPSDIVNTSEYIIVTIGIFDEAYIRTNYPEFFNKSENKTSFFTQKTDSSKWIDDGEDSDDYKEAGRDVDKMEGRYKVREYYGREGVYYTVINDEWMSAKKNVPNGISGRIPFIVVPTFLDVANPMGRTLFDTLRTAISITSKAINTISDNNELNNSMPYLAFRGSGLEGVTLSNAEPNIVVPVVMLPDIKKVHDMFHRPEVKEVSDGSAMLLSKGEEFIYLLAGIAPSFITGQQTPQMRTDGIAQMMQEASMRSQNNTARQLELVQNNLLWDWTRIFYLYYGDFGFDEQIIPREFLKDFDNIRVVPGSYLPSDKLSRVERAKTVLELALASPDAFELTKVYKDFLRAIGVSVPDAVLKGEKEMMREHLAMMIAQGIGEGSLQDEELQEQLKQLAELAAADSEDGK